MTVRRIAVFGSSEPHPGSTLYEEARQLGRLLAEAGYAVVTGGYGGVMEAASRGAREGGGTALGVGCEIFSHRSMNPYLDAAAIAADLHDRTRDLIEGTAGFVILAGKAGTLSELAMLWALDRAGCLSRCPVVLLGGRYPELLSFLTEHAMLDAAQLHTSHLAETPRAAVEAITRGRGTVEQE